MDNMLCSESRQSFVVVEKDDKTPSFTPKVLASSIMMALAALTVEPAMAGSVTISSANTSTYAIADGTALTVSSGGSITAGPAISVGNTVNSFSITNNGTINGSTAAGIQFSKASVTGNIINNSGGLIEGNFPAGIDFISTTLTGGITNNTGATILGNSAKGIHFHQSTMTGILTNAGTITSTTGGNGSALNLNTLQGASSSSPGSTIGGINNSGTMTGGSSGINIATNSSVTGSITNSGTITGTKYTGLYLATSSINGGITNTGTITGGVAGIDLKQGTVSSGINNSGSITSTSYTAGSWGNHGIRIRKSSIVNGGITNTGTISSAAAGNNTNGEAILLVTGSVVNNGITNSGTISGGNIGIRLANGTSVNGNITNSGTISGNTYSIKADAGSTLSNINITGSSARFIGDVFAQNTDVAVKAGATFSNDNAFDVKSFTVENTATFNMGASPKLGVTNAGITVANGFTNAGTLAVKAGTTAPINGNYTQLSTGTFKTYAASSSSFGKLSVSGTATFAADSKIDVNVTAANTLAIGQTLSGVISAGTLKASTFTVTDNSTLFGFTPFINGNNVDLKVSKVANIIDSVNTAGLTSGTGAAQVLDTFLSEGGTGTDIDNIITAFGKLNGYQQISDAVAQTLPLLTGSTAQISANTLHAVDNVIQARQSSFMGLSSGDGFLTDKHLWLKPVGSWTQQGKRNGVSGYTADSYGLVGGIDSDINTTTNLGFALSYMNNQVNGTSTASGNHATINAYQAIVYGSHNLENRPNVELNWQADVGINKNDGTRNINFGGLSRTAKANYNSYTGHIGAGIGKRYQMNDSTTLIPSIRADYAYIKDNGYTESGAGALNLNVNSNSAQELIAMAKGNLSHTLNDKATLVADLGVGYDFINDQTSLTASYAGGGTAFTTKGINPSPWLARAGAGIHYALSDTSSISAHYDVEGRRSFINQTASVKFRWLF